MIANTINNTKTGSGGQHPPRGGSPDTPPKRGFPGELSKSAIYRLDVQAVQTFWGSFLDRTTPPRGGIRDPPKPDIWALFRSSDETRARGPRLDTCVNSASDHLIALRKLSYRVCETRPDIAQN